MKTVNKAIDVFYVKDYSLQIKPIRFRILDSIYTDIININRIVRRDKEKINNEYVTTFTCEINLDDLKQLCDIRYSHNQNTWTLLRI